MNLLTHAYRDLAKGRQSVIGVDYDFKEGMVIEYSCLYVSLYCIACCLIACLSGCLPSIIVLFLYLITGLLC